MARTWAVSRSANCGSSAPWAGLPGRSLSGARGCRIGSSLTFFCNEKPPPGAWSAPAPLSGFPLPPRSRGLHPGIIVAIVAAVCLLGAVFVVGLIGVVRAGRLVASAGNISYGKNDAYAAATKPVVWTANTLNEQQVFKREAAFFQRQWIDGYIQRGDHTQACDADALKLLQAWQAPQTGTNIAGGTDELARRSDLLVADATCTDPLVLAAAGINATGHLPRVDRLQRAIQGFKASKHRAFPQFQTTDRTSPAKWPGRYRKFKRWMNRRSTCFARVSPMTVFNPGIKTSLPSCWLTAGAGTFIPAIRRQFTEVSKIAGQATGGSNSFLKGNITLRRLGKPAATATPTA